ncbi:unnamed protein product [Merluccius merluccius]
MSPHVLQKLSGGRRQQGAMDLDLAYLPTTELTKGRTYEKEPSLWAGKQQLSQKAASCRKHQEKLNQH